MLVHFIPSIGGAAEVHADLNAPLNSGLTSGASDWRRAARKGRFQTAAVQRSPSGKASRDRCADGVFCVPLTFREAKLRNERVR
jgi:hypothetical protein